MTEPSLIEALRCECEERAGLQEEAAPILRRARDNAFPDRLEHVDTGCDLHPACLTCPLPVCRYDMDAKGGARAQNLLRDAEIARLYQQRVGIKELTARFGIGRRSVFRALARAKQRQGTPTRRLAPPRAAAELLGGRRG